MDALFRIPSTKVTVDVDYILGLAAVVSDAAALIPFSGSSGKPPNLAPPGALAYMVMNVGNEFVIGSIPIVGDVFDIA